MLIPPKRTSATCEERGSIMVELAIFMPIMLGLLFLVYWAFLASGWRSAVATAVYHSVDLAIGRGDPVMLGVASLDATNPQGMMPALDALAETGAWDNGVLGTNTALGVLSSGGISGAPKTVYEDYIKKSDRWPAKGLTDFPPETYYAMAFAYRKLRASLPGDTRYPCDPDVADSHGCLICVPAKPAMWGVSDSSTVPDNAFAMECRYKPSSALLLAIVRLLNSDVNPDSLVLFHERAHFLGKIDSF